MARRRRGGRGGNSGSGGGSKRSGSKAKAGPPVRKLLINARETEESRIAILEGGRLEEYYLERESLNSALGNIYKARVTNVEKSFGAAFVEFGHDRQGFLHVSDLCMAAVGGESATLLAPLQAAREDAEEAEALAGAAAENGLPGGGPSGDGPAEGEEDAGGEEDRPEGHAALRLDGERDEEDDEPLQGGWDPDGGAAGAGLHLTEPADGTEEEPESLEVHAAGDDAAEDDDDDDEDEAAGEADEEAGAAAGEAPVPVGVAATAEAAAGGEATALKARRGGRRGGRGQGRSTGRSRDQRELPPIEEILHKGQEIVVQVIKDGIGTKGPTLTTYLSIPGRYVVLMPGIGKRGVSRKVEDPGERDRLKTVVRDLQCPSELGFIVRTAGVGASAEDLQRDLDYLLKLWEHMRIRVHNHTAPVLLYQENDLVIRTLRDLYDGQGEVITDDPSTAQTAREFMSQIMPGCVDRIRVYEGDRPLFNHYGLEAEIGRLLESRVELKSGATLVMEQTEALVAIDVNSSRYKGAPGMSIEEAAYTVNMEAADEIARQIRLRDLGGLVVVDFIDMRFEKHRKSVERQFKEALRRDRARIKVARFSPFGLIELTRQRVRPSLKRSVHDQCPYCTGTGFIPSDETSCLTVVRKIRDNIWRPGSVLVVTVRPEVAEAVLNTQREVIAGLEKEAGKQVFVRADHRLSYEEVELRTMVALPSDWDHRRA